ncbi:uncharacterized protein FTJAE_5052 [Fusarium tjaetaba]|uniref:Uncharacterized protein n=1 Tax=Fusarium tjaetaba TaxID=1567544 RepID=A0A8H5RQA1_9HYPO|nr:uncharacterized protein FTJAE_5052 [Fusarium tjaetaba]KAF5638981.1 hypothetical protein FTJAE_5052 [Fusarium tjaetaba]
MGPETRRTNIKQLSETINLMELKPWQQLICRDASRAEESLEFITTKAKKRNRSDNKLFGMNKLHFHCDQAVYQASSQEGTRALDKKIGMVTENRFSPKPWQRQRSSRQREDNAGWKVM